MSKEYDILNHRINNYEILYKQWCKKIEQNIKFNKTTIDNYNVKSSDKIYNKLKKYNTVLILIHNKQMLIENKIKKITFLIKLCFILLLFIFLYFIYNGFI